MHLHVGKICGSQFFFVFGKGVVFRHLFCCVKVKRSRNTAVNIIVEQLQITRQNVNLEASKSKLIKIVFNVFLIAFLIIINHSCNVC